MICWAFPQEELELRTPALLSATNRFPFPFKDKEMQLSRDNVLWFAGLFEGEGFFQYMPKSGRPSMGIRIKMTDKDVLDRLQLFFGGKMYVQKKAQPHHKQAWIWALHTRDKAYALLAATYQFLGARRQDQAGKWIDEYKTTRLIGRTSRHGNNAMWSMRKCRCEACMAAHKAYAPVLAERNKRYHLRQKRLRIPTV